MKPHSTYVGNKFDIKTTSVWVPQQALANEMGTDFTGCVFFVELWHHELAASEVGGLKLN